MNSTKLWSLALVLLAGLESLASGTLPPPVRDVSQYNLVNQLGMKGYDPVSYFSEGGGKATAGSDQISTEYKQVTYFFANQNNKTAFLTNPKKYEPTYGGWCAFAMASGQKVDIDPELFTIAKNRLHVFIASEAKLQFDANIPAFERRADIKWKNFTGEDPRK